MRICYFADGRSIHTRRWIRFCVGSGHEMHLISYAPMTEYDVSEMDAIGVKIHGNTGNFHLRKVWLTLSDIRFVKSVLKKEKIDILHSHFLGANAWFSALSRFHPHIITVMGGDVIGDDWTPTRNLQERLLTPYSLRNADAVTAWSPHLAEIVRPYLRPDTLLETIHGGVDTSLFTNGCKPKYLLDRLEIPESSNVVFSPRLTRSLYNIDKIAHAAGIVCDKLPDTVFVMAIPSHIADVEYIEGVKGIFASNSARDKVRYVPTIAHNEIVDYFRLADITVSIPTTDGTPMAVLESMSCETATVVGHLPGYDPFYFANEQTTLTADVNAPRAVADAIVRLLSDDELYGRITTEARRRVEETGSYEFQMNKMERLYQKLMVK